MIQFLNYRKNYGREIVLSLTDLSLTEQLYWIKGKNGSGKTTLLKSIAGLIPFCGDIKIRGLSNNKKNRMTYRKLVSYGASEPMYPEFLKGSDLVLFYQNIRKGGDQQIDFLIKLFGIEDFYSSKIGTYSSGMVKKLSLVLAFIGKPQLILLDEPFITLDVKTRDELVNLINLSLSKGVYIVFTSHQEVSDESKLLPSTVLMVENKDLICVGKC